MYLFQLLSSIEKVWDIIIRRGDKEIRRTKQTGYMIVGPMETEEQGITGINFK